MPGYREALIETAVCLNAAQAAFDLRQEVERAGKWEIEVLYGVYNLFTHKVSTPLQSSRSMEVLTNLAYAPTNPRDFNTLAVEVAKHLRANAAIERGDAAAALQEPAGNDLAASPEDE